MKFFFTFILLLCPTALFAEQISLNSRYFEQKQIIEVHLPESYHSNTKRHYPVLYVLHGQWDTQLTNAILTTLQGDIPEFIVVGIHGKGAKLAPTGAIENNTPSNKQGHQFRHYINNELLPYINTHYRSANYAMLVAHSNAGRMGLEYLLNGTTFANDYITVSPSLDDGYINRLATAAKALNGFLFISLADEGEHMEQPFDKLTAQLSEQQTLNLVTKKYPNYGHQSSKAIALVDALRARFAHWQPNSQTKKAGFTPFMAHYAKLEAEFGFKVSPQQDDLLRLMAYFAVEGQQQEVNQFIEFISKHTNEGDAAIKQIKDYLATNGYADAAKRIQL